MVDRSEDVDYHSGRKQPKSLRSRTREFVGISKLKTSISQACFRGKNSVADFLQMPAKNKFSMRENDEKSIAPGGTAFAAPYC
jgi:hypothetical protein